MQVMSLTVVATSTLLLLSATRAQEDTSAAAVEGQGPAFTAKEWTNFGNAGGGDIDGITYNPFTCLSRALVLEPKLAHAWAYLGRHNGGLVDGKSYNRVGCFGRALELDPRQAQWWHHLGNEWGGKVDGQPYTRQEAYKKRNTAREEATKEWKHAVDSRKADPLSRLNTNDWFALGEKNGGSVDGQKYGQKECYENAIIANPPKDSVPFAYARAWARFGAMGGGTINGDVFTAKEAILKALRISPSSPAAWLELGRAGGETVREVTWTAKECFVEALEGVHNKDRASAWLELGRMGGGIVRGVEQGKKDCVVKALEQNKQLFDAFAAVLDNQTEGAKIDLVKDNAIVVGAAFEMLAEMGGGKVRTADYSVEQCKQIADAVKAW
jgi:tetratricopeptide (TPR) repeat protein